jgi:hypothetical protein
LRERFLRAAGSNHQFGAAEASQNKSADIVVKWLNVGMGTGTPKKLLISDLEPEWNTYELHSISNAGDEARPPATVELGTVKF